MEENQITAETLAPESTTDGIDVIVCETCGASGDIKTMTMMVDVWMCEKCITGWRTHMASCEHDWHPGEVDGETGKQCYRCDCFIADEDIQAERVSKTAQTMPAPDQTVLRKDGTETVAMFFYAPSEHPLDEIAAEYGFDSKFMGMEDDPEADDALYDEWDKATSNADGNTNDVIRAWHPTLGDGWKLAEKYDTEDGPVACFIRRKAGA